jgi:hypothetical protein
LRSLSPFQRPAMTSGALADVDRNNTAIDIHRAQRRLRKTCLDPPPSGRQRPHAVLGTPGRLISGQAAPGRGIALITARRDHRAAAS